MTEILIDTEKMVRQLETSGVPTVQARAHVSVLLEIIAAMETAIIERCATKQDILELRDEIRTMRADSEARFAQIDVQFAKVDARFAKVDARITEVDARITAVNSRITEVNSRITEVNSRITEVNSRITEVDAHIAALIPKLIGWAITFGIIQTGFITALLLKLVH